MAGTFDHSLYSAHKKNNLYVHNDNTPKYGDKAFESLGHIYRTIYLTVSNIKLQWNSLPDSVKHETSKNIIIGYIKT